MSVHFDFPGRRQGRAALLRPKAKKTPAARQRALLKSLDSIAESLIGETIFSKSAEEIRRLQRIIDEKNRRARAA